MKTKFLVVAAVVNIALINGAQVQSGTKKALSCKGIVLTTLMIAA